MGAIQTIDLAKDYDEIVAVEAVNLEIAEGEVYGLIGPIGSGKSTLIRMLATLVEPEEGEATIAGLSVTQQPEAVRAKVGFLSDLFGVYDDMQIGEYFEFFVKALKMDPARCDRRIDELMALAGIDTPRDVYIDRLDRAMKQRLSLVKTLLNDPPILLLDEPCTRLMPCERTVLRDLIGRIATPGRTALVTSNILTDLVGLCDRLGVMIAGRIVAEGPTEEIVQCLSGARRLELRPRENEEKSIGELLRAHSCVRHVLTDRQSVVVYVDFTTEDAAPWVEGLVSEHQLPIEAWRELELDLGPILDQLCPPA